MSTRAGMTPSDSAVFLCSADDLGAADTCCCCGGSASLGGTQHPIPGSVPSLRYCSTECHDEWEDYLAGMRAWAESAFCPLCGFDNHEHDEGCSGVKVNRA